MDYDVIIIGGGPNGETAAAYLQKAGARCLIIERRDEMGGGLVTEDVGGFRFNLHATYMMMTDLMPPVQDLALHKYGVNFITPPVQMALFYEPDQALVLYQDPDKTAESIRKIAPEDASRFLDIYGDMREVCLKSLLPATYVAPIGPAEFAVMLSQSEVGNKVLEWSEMSPLEMLDEYGIEDRRVRAALLYLGCKWGVEPDLIGIGYMFAIYVYRMLNAALVAGGSHRLNSGIVRSAYESGLDVLENTEVTQILVEDGVAKGVVTDSGEEITARAVVSTLSAPTTFFDLVGEDLVDPDMASSLRMWQWDEWSLFLVHMGSSKLPRYRAEANAPHAGEALSQVVGYASDEEVIKHWDDSMNGVLPGTGATVTPISLFDPVQAPAGFHTLRVETEAPYEVRGHDWNDIKDEYAERIIADWREYLANSAEVKLVKRFVYPPTYIEQKLPNMVRGSIKHGAYLPTQMGFFRPTTETSNYATPIEGLYLAGATVYPGGMITLGPGYNAALQITADLGLDIWWRYPDYIEDAREAGLVP
ncbi:MAG: phytoene desaturase family protein [Thermoplasmata archaeon]